MVFFAIYVFSCFICVIIMLVAGVDNHNSIIIALSCLSNVGLPLDSHMGPVMTWGVLPDYVKWICTFLMLVGRLEIISVLVLFTRSYWKEN